MWSSTPAKNKAATRIPGGSLLPEDVSQHQIDWELNLGTIEEVPDEHKPAEDEDEPDAEAEGDDEDPDAGTPVDS